MDIAVAQYDPHTNTFTVDFPGRPLGPLPRFKTLEEAKRYITDQTRNYAARTAQAKDDLS